MEKSKVIELNASPTRKMKFSKDHLRVPLYLPKKLRITPD